MVRTEKSKWSEIFLRVTQIIDNRRQRLIAVIEFIKPLFLAGSNNKFYKVLVSMELNSKKTKMELVNLGYARVCMKQKPVIVSYGIRYTADEAAVVKVDFFTGATGKIVGVRSKANSYKDW
jgi:hypothetical protein